MIWNPSTDYRLALKKGMSGTDCAALQINLPVTVDGDFGAQTKKAVESFQLGEGLAVDGIAGLHTQQALCVKLSTPAARREELPVGLLKSLLSNESGFAVAAVSRHPTDSGLDIGAYQLSTGSGTAIQEFYASAYDVRETAGKVAVGMRQSFSSVPNPVPSAYLSDLAEGDPYRFRWMVSILNHNWPAAAYNIPRYGSVFRYEPHRDDEPSQWILDASAGRLSTPREWVTSYVQRATVYVRW